MRGEGGGVVMERISGLASVDTLLSPPTLPPSSSEKLECVRFEVKTKDYNCTRHGEYRTEIEHRTSSLNDQQTGTQLEEFLAFHCVSVTVLKKFYSVWIKVCA